MQALLTGRNVCTASRNKMVIGRERKRRKLNWGGTGREEEMTGTYEVRKLITFCRFIWRVIIS